MSLLDFAHVFWHNPAKANAAGFAPISLRLTLAGRRTEVATKVRCTAQQWDSVTHRLHEKGPRKHPDAKVLNQALRSLESKVVLLRNQLPATTTLAELRAALCPPARKPEPAAAPAPCALQLLAAALSQHTNHYTLATYGAALTALKRHLAGGPHEHYLPLPACTSEWATDLHQALQRTHGLGSAARHLLALQALWRRALPGTACPFAGLARAKDRKRQRPRHVLTPTERHALAALDLADDVAVVRDIYLAQYYLYGSRVGVVLELQWSQVDIARGRVRLRADKGGEWESLLLVEPLRQLLLRYAPAAPRPDALVFPLLPAGYHQLQPAARYRARKRGISAVWARLQVCAKLLELPGRLHSHTARHTLALDAYKASGGDLRVPQQMLRHSKLSMTEQYIQGLSTEELDTRAAAVYNTD